MNFVAVNSYLLITSETQVLQTKKLLVHRPCRTVGLAALTFQNQPHRTAHITPARVNNQDTTLPSIQYVYLEEGFIEAEHDRLNLERHQVAESLRTDGGAAVVAATNGA